MFNCRNNLTFKPFLPFTLKLGLGGPSDGIARNGGARGQGEGAQGGKVLFSFLPFLLLLFLPFLPLLFLPFLPFTSRYRPRK